MKVYKTHSKMSKPRWRKVLVATAVVLIIVVSLGFGYLWRAYTNNLLPVNTSSSQEVVVTIPAGASITEIAANLKDKGLIRSTLAFSQYIRIKNLTNSIKAGTYKLAANQGVSSMVKELVDGKVAVGLFTILPGQRLDQIRQAFIKSGYDAATVDKALNPENYTNMSALQDKPSSASLEGYLYPDSYQITADTLPATIIRAALNEMGNALSADVRKSYAAKGINIFEAVTLASIVEREVNGQKDRATAAQVFFRRMSIGMQLGSDVTACYGAIAKGAMKPGDNCNNFVGYDSPYNTRIYTGLPPGPISNVTKSGIDAIAFPSSTDYLFFVAGDDGVTHFTRTVAEHNAAAAQYCKKLCE